MVKINIKEIRRRAARRGCFTIADVARLVPCRRETVYFAVAQPSKFPIAYKRIMEVVGD